MFIKEPTVYEQTKPVLSNWWVLAGSLNIFRTAEPEVILIRIFQNPNQCFLFLSIREYFQRPCSDFFFLKSGNFGTFFSPHTKLPCMIILDPFLLPNGENSPKEKHRSTSYDGQGAPNPKVVAVE
jgi:hypothetical protein